MTDNPQDAHWSSSRSDGKLSHSLERAIAILEAFTAEHPVRQIQELVSELGMRASTVRRYIANLLMQGLVERAGYGEYRLTLAGVDLGLTAIAATGLRDRSRQPLKDLARHTGHTASLSVLDGEKVAVLVCVSGDRGGNFTFVSESIAEGSRQPAYCRASGKVLLAGLSASEQHSLLEQMTLSARTSATITSRLVLQEELRQVNEDRLAVEDGEFDRRLLAIGAPVFDDAGETVAAVTLSGSSIHTTVPRLRDELASNLQSTAAGISLWMSYRGDYV